MCGAGALARGDFSAFPPAQCLSFGQIIGVHIFLDIHRRPPIVSLRSLGEQDFT
jgi:hypothetical protein